MDRGCYNQLRWLEGPPLAMLWSSLEVCRLLLPKVWSGLSMRGRGSLTFECEKAAKICTCIGELGTKYPLIELGVSNQVPKQSFWTSAYLERYFSLMVHTDYNVRHDRQPLKVCINWTSSSKISNPWLQHGYHHILPGRSYIPNSTMLFRANVLPLFTILFICSYSVTLPRSSHY